EDFWEFQPTHTLILATNHKPTIRGTDRGIWRRLQLIPFAVSVEGQGEDKAMPEKLRAERQGILAWCVKGCLAWQQQGLNPPSEILEATDKYRADEDLVGSFLNESCVFNREFRIKASQLYERYKGWAERSGETPLPQRRFGQMMTERGYERYSNDGIWYRGL